MLHFYPEGRRQKKYMNICINIYSGYMVPVFIYAAEKHVEKETITYFFTTDSLLYFQT